MIAGGVSASCSSPVEEGDGITETSHIIVTKPDDGNGMHTTSASRVESVDAILSTTGDASQDAMDLRNDMWLSPSCFSGDVRHNRPPALHAVPPTNGIHRGSTGLPPAPPCEGDRVGTSTGRSRRLGTGFLTPLSSVGPFAFSCAPLLATVAAHTGASDKRLRTPEGVSRLGRPSPPQRAVGAMTGPTVSSAPASPHMLPLQRRGERPPLDAALLSLPPSSPLSLAGLPVTSNPVFEWTYPLAGARDSKGLASMTSRSDHLFNSASRRTKQRPPSLFTSPMGGGAPAHAVPSPRLAIGALAPLPTTTTTHTESSWLAPYVEPTTDLCTSQTEATPCPSNGACAERINPAIHWRRLASQSSGSTTSVAPADANSQEVRSPLQVAAFAHRPRSRRVTSSTCDGASYLGPNSSSCSPQGSPSAAGTGASHYRSSPKSVSWQPFSSVTVAGAAVMNSGGGPTGTGQSGSAIPAPRIATRTGLYPSSALATSSLKQSPTASLGSPRAPCLTMQAALSYVPVDFCRAHRGKKSELVRLSRDGSTLVAGGFRVSEEGCLTVRNFLLLNPRRIDDDHRGELLDAPNGGILTTRSRRTSSDSTPNAIRGKGQALYSSDGRAGGAGETSCQFTSSLMPHGPPPAQQPFFALHSTSMDTPYSPITYSLDHAFPPTQPGHHSTGDPPLTSEGRLLRAARDEMGPPADDQPPTESGNSCNSQFLQVPERLPGARQTTSPLPSPVSAGLASLCVSSHAPDYASRQGSQQRLSKLPCSDSDSVAVEPCVAAPPQRSPLHTVSSQDNFAHSLLLPYVDIPTQQVALRDIKAALPAASRVVRYVDLEVLVPVGEGASATVLVAMHLPTGRRLAVKRIDLHPIRLYSADPFSAHGLYGLTADGRGRQLQHIVIRELQVLHLTYRSPFMVKVYNAFFHPGKACLDVVMEFMHYGSLDRVARLLQSHAKEHGRRRRRAGVTDQLPKEASGRGQPATWPVAQEVADTAPHRSGTPSPTPPMIVTGMRDEDSLAKRNADEGGASSCIPIASPSTPHKANACNSSGGIDDDLRDAGEVAGVVEELCGVPERLVAVVGEQLLRGVCDMHARGYIHRDIKPGNVLINEHGVIKLSDFGLSQRCDDTGTGIASPPLQPLVSLSTLPTRDVTPVLSPDFQAAHTASAPHLSGLPVLPPAMEPPGPLRSGGASSNVASGPFQWPLPPQEGQPHHGVTGQPHNMGGLDAISVSSSGGMVTCHEGSSALDPSGALQLPSLAAVSRHSSTSSDSVHCSGTDKYMSPERQRGERHGKPCDIWAVGVTLAEFALGEYPYDCSSCVDAFERVHRMERPIDVQHNAARRDVPLSDVFADFVRLATLPNPADRPTAAELLEHPFFRQWSEPFHLKAYLARRIPIPSNIPKNVF